MGNLSNLKELILNDNQLTGTIPSELGNLSNLQKLLLHNNNFEGDLPEEVNDLDNNENSLEVSLWGNPQFNFGSLSGRLLAGMQKVALSSFYLDTDGDNWTNNDNWDTEMLSGRYGITTNSDGEITKLILDNNNLRGKFPSGLWTFFPSLMHLDLSQNQLNGTIPAELGNLTGLLALNLSDNQLSGAIPAELAALTNMLDLGLGNNQLSCDIPDLSPLSLFALNLQNNYQLGGTLSESLVDSWDEISTLDISCTSIRTPESMEFEDWLNGITIFRSGCMGTVEAACPSPPVSPREQEPVDTPVDTPVDIPVDTPVDTPSESPQLDGGGGCAIASNAGAGETSQGIVFDLILVMSALLVIPWRNHSAAKKT